MSAPAARVALALFAGAGLAGCGGGGGEVPPPPQPGVAAVACGAVVRRDEVERVADALAAVNPAWSRRALLRAALYANALPRAATHARYDEASRAARAELEADLAAGAAPLSVAGTVAELGFDVWYAARDLEPGSWSPPAVARDAWLAARVVGRSGDPGTSRERLELEVLRRPFLPPGADPQDAVRACGPEVPDPELRELAPYPLEPR